MENNYVKFQVSGFNYGLIQAGLFSEPLLAELEALAETPPLRHLSSVKMAELDKQQNSLLDQIISVESTAFIPCKVPRIFIYSDYIPYSKVEVEILKFFRFCKKVFFYFEDPKHLEGGGA